MTNNVINEIASKLDREFAQQGINKQTHSYEWEQRFGEAVIEECLRRIRGTHLAAGYDPDVVSEWELGYQKGVDQCLKMVKQHFGIK